MQITKRETIYEGDYLRIVKKYFTADSGHQGVWEVVERKKVYKRVVIIFALTENREVVLEKQFRITCECPVIELPAGLTDQAEESEEQTAQRELFEETGYQAQKVIPFFSSVAAPGLTNSEYVYFFAPNARFIGQNKGDDNEEIEVFTVPVDKLVDFCLEQQNNPAVKVDDKILNLLPILQKKNLI